MKIYAIGIYTTNEDCSKFQKTCSVPEEKSGFFSTSLLANLEEKTLPILTAKAARGERVNNVLCFKQLDRENHYYLKKIDDNTGDHIILAIVTTAKLREIEQIKLFNNIDKVRIGLAKDTTLKDILDNPINYVGREIILGQISTELAKVKSVMDSNMELFIERQEKLESLKDKALNLTVDAVKFKEKTEMYQCCGYGGYGY